jgi:hypothetical protein
MKKIITLYSCLIIGISVIASCCPEKNKAEKEASFRKFNVSMPDHYWDGGREEIVYTILIEGQEYYVSYYDRSRTIWPKTKTQPEKQ